MYIQVVDVNKDQIFFLFGVLIPAKHIRDNEATTSWKLIFFNALTDVPII